MENEQFASRYGYEVERWQQLWYVIGPRDRARDRTKGVQARKLFSTQAEAWEDAVRRIKTAKREYREYAKRIGGRYVRVASRSSNC